METSKDAEAIVAEIAIEIMDDHIVSDEFAGARALHHSIQNRTPTLTKPLQRQRRRTRER